MVHVPGSSPEVIVIGGGIVGTSAAASLAEAGLRVTLVERAEIGAGASGRNSGVVQHPFDPVLVDLHLETLDAYRRLAAGSDGAFALPAAPSGLLYVTHDVALVRRLTDELLTVLPGLSPTFVGPDDARHLEPGLAPGVAACRVDIGYPVGPIRATSAYAAHARRCGVEIVVGAAARPVAAGGRVVGVDLADGRRLPAGAVLVAAGPWSPALIDPTGGWRPIEAVWGVVLSVALADAPRHVLEEAEIDIEPSETPEPSGIAFSLVTADGASSVGSTFLDDEPDAAAYLDPIVRRAARFVPAIASAPRLGHRVCARPQSRDGRPLVGPVPGIEGLWIAAGHGPWGISTGPASGRLVADLIAARPGAVVPPALDPARFGSPRLG